MKITLTGALLFLLSLGLHGQVWSSDGTKIAFFYIHAIEDIYLVNPDGSNFKAAPNNAQFLINIVKWLLD